MSPETREALLERVAVEIVRAGYNPATALDIAREAIHAPRSYEKAHYCMGLETAAQLVRIRSTSPTPHAKETPDAG